MSIGTMGQPKELQPILGLVTLIAIIDTILGFCCLSCCGALFGVAIILSCTPIVDGCYAPVEVFGVTIPIFGDYCISSPMILILWLIAFAFMVFSIWLMTAALKLLVACLDGRESPRIGASCARTWMCFSLFFTLLTIIQYVEFGYRYWVGYFGVCIQFSHPYFAAICASLFFRIVAYIIVRKYAQLLDHNIFVASRPASICRDV